MIFENFEDLEDCFQLFDSNHNGYLNTQELSNAFRALGLNPSLGQVEKLLQSVDLHHRNQINVDEFAKLFGLAKPECSISKEQLIREISKFDRDRNGFIDADELRNILSSRGEPLDSHHIDEILHDFDTNGDGRLSIEELANGLLGLSK
ncbi:unnamed protein product [Blepharisma stoltei]|uniref:Calmodulin n=1 Tax=Blepharisma stoltei TaxID=1481888 RepID=A0AAU9J2X0_9CILI|nr:unnamed protein product [Blepharisma stoltei]